MDVLLLLSITILLSFLIFIGLRAYKLHRDENAARNRTAALLAASDQYDRNEQRQQQQRPLIIGGRRQGARRRPVVRHEEESEFGGAPLPEGDSDQEDAAQDWTEDVTLPDGKVGKKKMAKLQAKAEKRAQREGEIRDREERKQREAEREERRKKDDEKEKQQEAEREEAERLAREEKERQEHEEYLKLKEAFSIEEEGFDEEDSAQSENLLREFVEYVKQTKVVNVDELASHFKLSSQAAVDRLQTLVADDTLTGVIDDRGKFIYISMDELRAVAKFINQRGRVSVTELTDYSNQLIKLEAQA